MPSLYRICIFVVILVILCIVCGACVLVYRHWTGTAPSFHYVMITLYSIIAVLVVTVAATFRYWGPRTFTGVVFAGKRNPGQVKGALPRHPYRYIPVNGGDIITSYCFAETRVDQAKKVSKARPLVLLVVSHGNTCSLNDGWFAQGKMMQAHCDANLGVGVVAVVGYDYRGYGSSTMVHEPGFDQTASDCEHVVRAYENFFRHSAPRVCLYGMSLGGNIASRTACSMGLRNVFFEAPFFGTGYLVDVPVYMFDVSDRVACIARMKNSNTVVVLAKNDILIDSSRVASLCKRVGVRCMRCSEPSRHGSVTSTKLWEKVFTAWIIRALKLR